LRLLSAPCLSAQIEQFLLRSDRSLGFGIAVLRPLQQHPRKCDLVGAVPLGLKSRLRGKQFIEILGDDVGVRKRLGLVQADENVAGVDPVSLTHA